MYSAHSLPRDWRRPTIACSRKLPPHTIDIDPRTYPFSRYSELPICITIAIESRSMCIRHEPGNLAPRSLPTIRGPPRLRTRRLSFSIVVSRKNFYTGRDATPTPCALERIWTGRAVLTLSYPHRSMSSSVWKLPDRFQSHVVPVTAEP